MNKTAINFVRWISPCVFIVGAAIPIARPDSGYIPVGIALMLIGSVGTVVALTSQR